VEQQENQMQQWVDAGSYLSLVILPLILLVFRRGFLSIAIIVILIPSIYSEPVLAESAAVNFMRSDSWNKLWLNKDQRGIKDFKRKKFSQAAEHFNDPQWKAGAHYRAGEFDQAVEQYDQFDDADSLYNMGNAQANLKEFEQAIESYDAALKKNPELIDAKKNRDYIKELLKKQQEQQSKQGESDKKQQQDNEKEKDPDNEQKESEQQQNDDQKDDQQEDSQQDNSENSQSEKSKQADQADKDQKSEQQQADDNKSKDAEQQTDEEQESTEEKESQSAEQQDIEKADTPEGDNTTEDVLSQLSQEEQQSLKQWLQRIPDNPGELLRIKFRNNSLNKQRQKNAPAQYEGNPW